MGLGYKWSTLCRYSLCTKTALHVAADNGYTDVVDVLLEFNAGADTETIVCIDNEVIFKVNNLILLEINDNNIEKTNNSYTTKNASI